MLSEGIDWLIDLESCQTIELTVDQSREMKNGWGSRMDKERDMAYEKELAKEWQLDSDAQVSGGPMLRIGMLN